MGKTIKANDPQSKRKYTRRKRQPSDDCHGENYEKKHEKGHWPRKVWPTDSERRKDKGHKI